MGKIEKKDFIVVGSSLAVLAAAATAWFNKPVVSAEIESVVEAAVRNVVKTETLISPTPLPVEVMKEFVKKDDFNEFLRQYRDDIRRIEGRVADDLRDASTIRQTISGQVGEMRGELRQISLLISALQRRE